MKKILFLICLLACGATALHAQKFALVDMEYILGNIPAYERANEQLNQISKKWQAEVEALDNEAQTLYKNYQKPKRKSASRPSSTRRRRRPT